MASKAMVGYRDLIGALSGGHRIGYDEQIGDDLGDDLGDEYGDELGDDLGDDLSGMSDGEIGARIRRMRGRGSRLRSRGRGARIPANRIYDLGLGSITIAAGLTGILTGSPAIRFRVDRLFLVPTLPGLIMLDLKVGIVSQTVGGAGSPVESFGPTAIGARMSGQTLDPAVPVTALILNPTAGVITISGNIIGKADQ